MHFAFINLNIAWVILKPVLSVAITTIATLHAWTQRDKARTEKYNLIVDDILNVILFERPQWDFLEDGREIKDLLVNAILANQYLTDNPTIAERLARSAIVRARKNK